MYEYLTIITKTIFAMPIMILFEEAFLWCLLPLLISMILNLSAKAPFKAPVLISLRFYCIATSLLS